jgi:hypothetical protein
MSGRVWVVVGVCVAALLGLLWVASSFGVFATPEDLDRNAESLDAGVLEDWPFDGVDLDASVPDAGREVGSHALALSGRGVVGLHNFSLNDHQGRNVLKVQSLRGLMDLGALRHGIYRVHSAKAHGVEVTLYRDQTGKLSLTDALSESPAPLKSGLETPPKAKSKEGAWLIEIGPVRVEDATLTIAFTKKLVRIHVESAVITVRRRPEDSAPHIYLEQVQGEMLEPKPLPHPVRIAFAEGLVRLKGAPMVDLVARTCIGRDELRVHAIVPARKEPVELTVDSAGVAGALGRMGLEIASRRKHDKLHYQHGPVKLEGGPGCSHHDAADEEQ